MQEVLRLEKGDLEYSFQMEGDDLSISIQTKNNVYKWYRSYWKNKFSNPLQIYNIINQYIKGELPDTYTIKFPEVYEKYQPLTIYISCAQSMDAISGKLNEITIIVKYAVFQLDDIIDNHNLILETLSNRMTSLETAVEELTKFVVGMNEQLKLDKKL